MKSIMIICNSLGTGGAEVQTVALANGLSRKGHPITLICLSPIRDLFEKLDPLITENTVLIARKNKIDYKALVRIRDEIAKRDIDVILTVNNFPTLYGVLARGLSFHIPIVTVFHTTKIPEQEVFRFYLTAWWAFKFSKRVIYVCEAQRKYWAMRFLHVYGRACVTYNGVDPEKFQLADQQLGIATRRILGIPDHAFCLASVAMFRPEKQHAEMLKALHEIRLRNVDCHFIFVGDGPEKEHILDIIEQLDLKYCVHIVGKVADVTPYLAAADGTVILSSTETFSLAVLESLSTGCPVFAYDIGGIPEQVVDGVSGGVIPQGQRNLFVDFIVNTSISHSLFDRQIIREIAISKFSNEKMIGKYSSLLSEL